MAIGKRDSRGRSQAVSPRTGRRPIRQRRGRSGFTLSSLLEGLVQFSRPILAILFLLACLISYSLVIHSRVFALRKIQVTGATDAVKPEVEDAARKAVGQSRLLEVNLPSLRQKLEEIARVHTARVSRALPDELRIEVTERQPAVPVLKRQETVWYDAEGVELGDVSTIGLGSDDVAPPIAKGFDDGPRTSQSIAEDKDRIAVYQRLEHDFTQKTSIWRLIDKVDLLYVNDVSVLLVRPPVWIHLGKDDFRNRAETALKLLDALNRGDAELLGRFKVQDAQRIIQNPGLITYIDAARTDRIVFRLAGAEAPKPVGPRKPDAQEPKKQESKKQESKKKAPSKHKK